MTEPEPAPLADTADGELVERARRGDSHAYAELWRRHYNAGRTVARSFSSSLDPDDLVQESFAKIYQAIQKGGGPTGAFRAYLFTTIRNTAAGWGRARHETTIDTLESFEDPETSEQSSIEALDRGLTAKAFRSLPTRWQEVLWYTEIEQMTPQQTAPLLGMKPNSVAALAYRAREGLRQAWVQAHLQAAPDGSEHQWTIERLGAYARNGLGERDTKKLERHLDECARCTIVAAEAKDVSSRIALVLLPLTAGVTGATAYLAWLQQGGNNEVVTVAMPAAVTGGAAVTVTTSGAAEGAAAGSQALGSSSGAGGAPIDPGAASAASTTSTTGSGAAGSTSGTAGGSTSGVSTPVVVGAVVAGVVAAAVAAAAVLGPMIFTPTSEPEAASTVSPSDETGADAGTEAEAPSADEAVAEDETEVDDPQNAPDETAPDSRDPGSRPPAADPDEPSRDTTAPRPPQPGQPQQPSQPPPATQPPTMPPAPTVFTPDTGNGTLFPILSGRARPGATVEVWDGGAVASRVTANTSGDWTSTPITTTRAGTRTLYIRQLADGFTSPFASTSVSISAPVVEQNIDDDGRVTWNRPQQYFDVHLESVAGTTVRLFANGAPLATTRINATTYRVSGPFPQPPATWTITAQYYDASTGRTGVVSGGSILTFVG